MDKENTKTKKVQKPLTKKQQMYVDRFYNENGKTLDPYIAEGLAHFRDQRENDQKLLVKLNEEFWKSWPKGTITMMYIDVDSKGNLLYDLEVKYKRDFRGIKLKYSQEHSVKQTVTDLISELKKAGLTNE